MRPALVVPAIFSTLGLARAIWAGMIAFAAVFVSSASAEVPTRPIEHDCCAVFELRQYTLRPGQRDVLIELFDREFIETQEAVGMHIYGQFRDADNPDRFVWVRAFPDMELRRRALTSFYSGPAWKAHGRQAAATMLDSDNVSLLRPIDPPGGFDDLPAARPSIGALAPPSALVTATIYSLRADARRKFPIFFRETLLPALREVGIVPRAAFETEHSPNTYPALPSPRKRERFRLVCFLRQHRGARGECRPIVTGRAVGRKWSLN